MKKMTKEQAVKVFSEREARALLREQGVDDSWYRLTLRELTCKEDFVPEQTDGGRKTRTFFLVFCRYHKYYMWVAVPRNGSYEPANWMVRATLTGAENAFAPQAVKIPRRVFGNPLAAKIAQKVRPANQEFVQVEDFQGSKFLLPSRNLKVSVTAKKMAALLGITPHQVLPRIFGMEAGWFVGLLLREKHSNGYSDYIVDCYGQRVFNRAGFEYLLSEQAAMPGAGNVRRRVTHEIPLSSHQKAIRWGGMTVRYNDDNIEIKIIE